MTRRSLLTKIMAPLSEEDVGPFALEFVRRWNEWATLLGKGVRDVRLEKRMVRAWRELERRLAHD